MAGKLSSPTLDSEALPAMTIVCLGNINSLMWYKTAINWISLSMLQSDYIMYNSKLAV